MPTAAKAERQPAVQQAPGEHGSLGTRVEGALRRIFETSSFQPAVFTRALFRGYPMLYFAEKGKEEKKIEPIKTQDKPSKNVPLEHAENADDVLAARTIEELLKQAAKTLPQEDTPQEENQGQ